MEYLIKACALLSLFYVLYVLFLRNETFFKTIRWYFIMGILVSICMPFIVITNEVEISHNPLEHMISSSNISDTLSTQTETYAINWEQMMWYIYFTGMILFSIKFIIELLSLKNHIQKGKHLKNGTYNLVEVTENEEPFSFFNWIVYNPNMYSEAELNQILIHEKSHVNGMHSYDLIISKITSIIFWFFPLTRLYTKAIKQNLEYLSDQQSSTKVQCIKSYQTLLLKQTLPNYKFQLVNQFYNSFIKNRIIMLNKTQSSKIRLLKLAIVLPFLAFFLMNFSSETHYVYKSESPENTFKKNESTKKRIEIVFSKNYSDKDLERIKKQLKDEGATLIINKLERNEEGVIISIDVTFKTKNGSANYNTANEKGIGAFVFSMDGDGSFGVKSIDKHPVLSKIMENDGKAKTEIITDIEYEFKSDQDSISSSVSKVIIDELDVDENFEIIVKSDNKNNIIIENGGVIIDSVVVDELINSKNDIFFEDGKKRKIKVNGNTFILKSNGSVFTNGKEKPLIILNGKEQPYTIIKEINPKHIDEVTVLKDKSAKALYGDKAKNGVVVISTDKDKKTEWVVDENVQVSSIAFFDDEDANKNATIVYISKDTPDDLMNQHKALLKKEGIDVKISKLRRNKNGEITSIKISLNDNKGSKSSASYKNDDGINSVEFGKSEGKLIVRSK